MPSASNITNLNKYEDVVDKVTYSSTTFRITFTGTASFTLSFSQGIAQVLGFLPNTTYTADSSFLITAPNTVNLSPNYTYFLTISNLPNSNQSSGSFTFSFFINVNQTSGQILFLSSSEKDQSIQMGNTITTNHLNVELRNRDSVSSGRSYQ